MTVHKIMCFAAATLVATATSYAQPAGSGYAGQHGVVSNCANGNCENGSGDCHQQHGCLGCSSHDKYPSDTCCCRPWTYQAANALWADYCTMPIREHGCHGGHGGCGCGQNHSKWPSNTVNQCNDGCGNFLSNMLGRGACGGGNCGDACGAGCGDACCSGQGGLLSGLFQKHGAGGHGWLSHHTSNGCDSGSCDQGLVDSGCGCHPCGSGPRHGFDLFSGLKSQGCGCGLFQGQGCDGVNVGSSCGCN